MLSVYLNYPVSKVSAHHDPDCRHVRAKEKPEQRVVRINIENLSTELQKFRDKQYPFTSTAQLNDMWLEIDLQDRDFEDAVAHYVQRLLGSHYKPFADALVAVHC
jgi:hypothetical protein